MPATSFCLLLLLVVLEQVVGQTNLAHEAGRNCGTDLRMECHFDGVYTADKDRIWSQPESTIIRDGESKNKTKYIEDTSLAAAFNHFSMTIKGFDINDAGDYFCIYDSRFGSTTLDYECYVLTPVAVCTNIKITITVDQVYPDLPTTTLTVTVADSGGTAVPGAITSTGSATYANHFTLTWTSDNTVADGRYAYSVGITTSKGGAEANLTTNAVAICVRPQTPVISNIQPNCTVVGTEGRPLTLTCTSRGGNPAPTVTWYRGSTQYIALSSSSTGPLEGDGYTVTATYTFTPARADDGDVYICLPSYTPTADVLDSVNMTLRLNLRPSTPTVVQVGEAEAGSNVTVRCTTSSLRPASGIAMTWTYNGSTITPVAAPSITGTDPYTATSTIRFPVHNADFGGRPECTISHPTLVTPLTASTTIDVHYAPESVNVIGSSPFTANGVNQLTLTCTFVDGNPGPSSISWSRTSRAGTVTQPASTQTILELTPRRDDDGDTITCTSNNSVGAVTSGPFTLDLHYQPVIIRTAQPVRPVAIQLGVPSTFSVTYYSNVANSTVTCHRVVNNVTQTASVGEVTYETSEIQLPVYGSMVTTQGTTATATLTLNSKSELGVYHMKITNTVGTTDVYRQTVSEGGYVMVEEIAQSPLNVYNGNDTEIVLKCKIVAIGYPETEEFTYWWTYNNKVIQPTSNSRFSLTSSILSFTEEKASSLSLKPVRLYDSGSYACFVAHKASGVEAGRNITVTVISQPVVTLTPACQTINESTNVALMCEVIRPLDGQFVFHWYMNSQPLQSRAGAELVRNATSAQLMITALTATTQFGCEAENEAGIMGLRAVSYIGVIPTKADPEKPAVCKEGLDYRGIVWPIAAVSTISVQDCPTQTVGTVSRKCKENGEWSSAKYDCVQQTIRAIQEQISQTKDGSGSANVTSYLGELANATDTVELLEGDMSAVVDALTSVANIADERITPAGESETETQYFLEVASNLLNIQHEKTWNAEIDRGQPGAMNIAQVVEKFIEAKLKQLSSSTNGTFTKHYTQKTIYAELGRRDVSDRSAYTFPKSEVEQPSWMADTTTALFIPAESFNGMPSTEYSSQVFRSLSDIVAKKFKINGQFEDSSMDINSDVMIAFQSQQPVANLDPPARITFQHSSPNFSRPICVFWDFGEATWSSEGCTMVSTSDTHTICSCNHFTNFAVLMSPGKTPGSDLQALSILSAIGCGISLFCLVLTVGAHLRVWRLVNSARTTLLMHLCVSLILAYLVFLAGINRAENKDVCTAVAVLLHYLWLVVFFLMMAEGIYIAVSVIYLFITKSRVKWLLWLAWGVPAIIVGISLGVSRLEGYGTDTFCWLSTEDGMLWAFVGPAAFVILVNFIMIITVLTKMFKSRAMLTKTDKEKAKTGVRSLCVLLPVLGLSWVFGILSVNEDLVAFQYLFLICNALQGFFISVFHCLLNRQLKAAWKQTRIMKTSLASFEDGYKKQTSPVTAFTTYYSADGAMKESNAEQVSIPFLEADIQMQEHAKIDKKGSANMFNKTPNDKLDEDKDKSNFDVALEDVNMSK